MDGGALRAELEASLAGRRAIGLQVWRWLSLEAWSQFWVARDSRASGYGAAGAANAATDRV